MAKPIVIGIAGGSASGKTTVAHALCEAFENGVVLLQQDSYYKHSDLPFEQRKQINYDHPDAFDHDLLVAQLQQLIQRHAIDVPIYDYAEHNRKVQIRHVKPQDVIILEGILVLADPALRDLMDVKLFVDTDADVRVLRRIQRDTQARGRSLNSVIDQYLTTVRPAYLEFIEPTKRFADVIIPEGGQNRVAIDLVRTKIAATLRHRGEIS
ncbi:uridine kinase [Lacticaseibacillus manihotivorans]|jgi:uridine kinase|uniref:Uridine kinase n=2 Tax=Lacticaseibacillus manihotivorans TaxID=88233 RepID=A0A0R1RGB3_9LACO|nr:uridine kinase [Lacticaseibacillus manihotivorans]KRL53237.1 uridine kinase [Lacticaseibacillus manihotivorans DSM 13343 = JCM 12514]QFQ91177.1 uridine kinase [Lacticaseibacillus manihotivorans]